MRFILLFSLLVFSTPSLAQAGDETREYFRDWLAACRPDGYCSATAYDNLNPEGGGVADYILRIGRNPVGTDWEISLTAIAAMPGAFSEMKVTIDNEAFLFFTSWSAGRFDGRYGAFDAVNDFFFTGPRAQKVLDRLIAGARASIAFTDENDSEQTAGFSLSGLAASMLWIDERQQRLGSERVAFGPPLWLTPVSMDFPRIVPPALLKIHASDPDCDPYEFLPNAHQIMQGQVEQNRWLYLLPCTSGAYNFAYKAYEGDGTYFSPIYFAQYGENTGWTGTPYAINPLYDAENSRLTTYTKGRGLGDCGSTGVWRWGEYGMAMLEYRSREVCDEKGQPGVFPLIFRNEFVSPSASKSK